MAKKLYRSKKNNIIAGICGGIAEYFEIDPNIVRLLWIAGTLLTGGTGLIVYVIAWFLIPFRGEK